MSARDEDPTGRRIVGLLAVARGLEDDGQYNAAKVFRAAALAEGFRATRRHPRPGVDLEEALDRAVADLEEAGHGDELLSVARRARDIVRGGGWPTLDEIPDLFVCRDCGEATVGEPPSSCPVCRGRALRFQEIGPIYFLEPMEIDDLLAALASGADQVEELTAGVTEEEAGRGEWPMRAIVSHLLGAERLLVGRAERMLNENDPEFVSVEPEDVTERDEGEQPSTSEMVERFLDARRATLSRLRSLSPEQWKRAGRHPEWGRLTVQQQLSYVALHEHSHLADLEARRLGE